MKNIILLLILSLGMTACNAFEEKEVSGYLATDPKSGWSSIRLIDDESGKPFDMHPGPYTLRFGLSYPFMDPKISIIDKTGNQIGVIKVPKKSIKRDGTFELYVGDSKNSINTNILGGRREVILKRERYAKIRQDCTYTETYACDQTGPKGETYSSVCTRAVSGDQDAVREKRQVKSFYRIIFDASDLANAAVFSGQSSVRSVDVEINSTSCG